jgi:hypothetical protein
MCFFVAPSMGALHEKHFSRHAGQAFVFIERVFGFKVVVHLPSFPQKALGRGQSEEQRKEKERFHSVCCCCCYSSLTSLHYTGG